MIPMPKVIRDYIQNHRKTHQRVEYPLADGSYYVRHDITCWQDDAVKINKEELRQLYIGGGAIDADIRIIRVPRQTVRSEAVLKVETLRDKLIAMAALNDETVPESILQKADELEAGEAEGRKAA